MVTQTAEYLLVRVNADLRRTPGDNQAKLIFLLGDGQSGAETSFGSDNKQWDTQGERLWLLLDQS